MLLHTTHNVRLWMCYINIFKFLVEEFRVFFSSFAIQVNAKWQCCFKITVSSCDRHKNNNVNAGYQCKQSVGKTFDYSAIARNIQCKILWYQANVLHIGPRLQTIKFFVNKTKRIKFFVSWTESQDGMQFNRILRKPSMQFPIERRRTAKVSIWIFVLY